MNTVLFILLADYRLCQSMLDLCGQQENDGTCGVWHDNYGGLMNRQSHHSHEIGDGRCDIVKVICRQVDEDTLYSEEYDYDYEMDNEAFERKLDMKVALGAYTTMNLDVHHGRINLQS